VNDRSVVVGVSLFFVASLLYGYDNRTVHLSMTDRAFAEARASHDFLVQLGLPEGTPLAGKTAAIWTTQGAHDEDERLGGAGVQFHFFDPVNESPMTVFKPTTCDVLFAASTSARDWAQDSADNAFDLNAAEDHYYLGMVGGTQQERDTAFVSMFLTLGHVMHLVQDMAQPQHTRNDFHLTFEETRLEALQFLASRTWSRYEKWCQLNLANHDDPAYSGYPIVKLKTFGSYFKTGDGRGLAEYANRNFVTEHTNFSDSTCAPFDYALPGVGTPRNEVHTVTTSRDYPDGHTVTSVDTYEDVVFTYETSDRYPVASSPAFTPNQNHDFLSFFDYELERKNGTRVYSLPASALASQAALLVRRAVGYSGGLLDHFFRGKIDATWETIAGGGAPTTYGLTITNRGDEPIGGDATISAVYKPPAGYFTNGSDVGEIVARGTPLQTLLVGFQGIAPGASVTIYLPQPSSIAPNETLNQFEKRIALRATVGSESGTVIGLVQPGSELRATLDAAPGGLLRMFISCIGSRPFTFRNIPENPFGAPPMTAIATELRSNEECRVHVGHLQPAKPDDDGTPVSFRLRVQKNGVVVEDLRATIDAGDSALGGCHFFLRDGHCDRFIARVGNCYSYPNGGGTVCPEVLEHWDWTGDYAVTPAGEAR
jgi:hypothetical protein